MAGTKMADFTDDQIKMRWREPYVTEGLNKKLAGVVPRGVYRGFRLASNGANMILDVLADPDKGDHVAVYETDTTVTERYSMRVEITSGNFSLDLTPWPSQTVYIAIYAEYATLGTTLANVRVYTAAEYAAAVEKDELVVLGTVAVPALGNVIPPGNISVSERTYPTYPQITVGDPVAGGSFSDDQLDQPRVRIKLSEKVGWVYQTLFSWNESFEAPVPPMQLAAKQDAVYGTKYIVLAHNCTWSESAAIWTRQETGSAFKMEIGGRFISTGGETISGLRVGHRRGTDATWTDNNWYSGYVLPFNVDGDVVAADLRAWVGQIPGGMRFGSWLVQLMFDGRLEANDVPRLSTLSVATADYTLVWELMQDASPTDRITRLYQAADGSMCIVTGAAWDSLTSKWVSDSVAVGAEAGRTDFGWDGKSIFRHTAFITEGDADFDDIEWSNPGGTWTMDLAASTVEAWLDARSIHGPLLSLLGASPDENGPRLSLQKSNPAVDAAIVPNTLYSANIIKAWAQIETNSVSPAGLLGGFGVSSYAYSVNALDVTLTNPLLSEAECAVVVTPQEQHDPIILSAWILTPSVIRIQAWRFSGGYVEVNLETSPRTLNIIVCGKQA